MRSRSTRWGVIVPLVSVAALLVATLAGCGSGDSGRHLTFGVSTTTMTSYESPFVSVPQAMGYWKEEGLNVRTVGFEGASASAQAVDAGAADVAMFSTSSLFAAQATKRAKQPMVGFYTAITRNYSTLAVLPDSPIRRPADLAGRLIGVSALEASQVSLVKAAMANDGADPTTVTFIPVGQGAPALTALRQHRVDMLALWDGPNAVINGLGQPLRLITSDYLEGLGFMSVLTTTRAQLDKDRAALVGLGRGIAKGMVFAQANPEAAVRIHWKLFPESKPKGLSEEAAMAQGITVLKARLANCEAIDGVWGRATDAQIEAVRNLLRSGGVLPTVPPESEVWTPQLLEEINKFDAAAVRKQAQEYRDTDR
ncbi:ABC transporter substrate-binding protein [Pseudonocardia acaciae]|uniref:ABC transporter substrate-binding protein n=1 Tax=Pseudonocardia acaciae TaxID=551276 RepID=UPI0004901A4F|nr:ABC transporter substrate-binding protein [Pseudonocardia acaciae]